MDKLWYLSKIKLFDNLSRNDMNQIDDVTRMSTIPKGTIVQTPFSNPNGLYIVKDGRLRLYTINSDGKQYTLIKEENLYEI